MTRVRSIPCEACPYRKDVPSGMWAEWEYEKLRRYDLETFAQPMATFACHVNPDHHCNGWAIVHTSRGNEFDLLALRLEPQDGPIPEEVVPLFNSGNEAADHGERDIDDPSPEARQAIARLLVKHPRLMESWEAREDGG